MCTTVGDAWITLERGGKFPPILWAQTEKNHRYLISFKGGLTLFNDILCIFVPAKQLTDYSQMAYPFYY